MAGIQHGLDGTEVQEQKDAKVVYTFIAGGYRAKLREDIAETLDAQVDKMRAEGKKTQGDIDDFLSGWVENAVRAIPRRKRAKADREALETLVHGIAVKGEPFPRPIIDGEEDEEGFGKIPGGRGAIRYRKDVRLSISWITDKWRVRSSVPAFTQKVEKLQKRLDAAVGDDAGVVRDEVRGLERDWVEHGMKLLPRTSAEEDFKRHADALQKAVFQGAKVRTRQAPKPKQGRPRMKKGKQRKLSG